MPKLRDTKTLPHPIGKVFRLAMDIDAYPEFLPYVKAMKTLKKRPGRIGARVTFGLGPLGFRFDCDIDYVENVSIHIVCRDKLFRAFEAHCALEDLGHGKTRIAYELHAAFRSVLLESIAEGLLRYWTRRTVRLFERRLDRL